MSMFPYLYIFLQSNLIEIPFYYLFYGKRANLRDVAILVSLSNMITHPIVFFGFMAMNRSYIVSILLAELFAIVAEALIHRVCLGKAPGRLTWDASIVANLASWQLAPLLTYWVMK